MRSSSAFSGVATNADWPGAIVTLRNPPKSCLRTCRKVKAPRSVRIRAGRPVVTYPEHWNMAVVYGYEDGGKTLLLRDYMTKAESARLPIEKLGVGQTYLGSFDKPPALRDALREALDNARESIRAGGDAPEADALADEIRHRHAND